MRPRLLEPEATPKLGLWRAFLHNVLAWHRPLHFDRSMWDHDGASYVSRCRDCGKKILGDSQSNWFVALDQDDWRGRQRRWEEEEKKRHSGWHP